MRVQQHMQYFPISVTLVKRKIHNSIEPVNVLGAMIILSKVNSYCITKYIGSIFVACKLDKEAKVLLHLLYLATSCAIPI